MNFPIENGGSFHSYVSLPEGKHDDSPVRYVGKIPGLTLFFNRATVAFSVARSKGRKDEEKEVKRTLGPGPFYGGELGSGLFPHKKHMYILYIYIYMYIYIYTYHIIIIYIYI